MRNTLFTLICLLLLFGCSTNNGATTVVPAAPTNLTGTSISGTQIILSWTDNATNETGYKIQRKTSVGNFTDVGSAGTDVTTFSDLGLTNNTAYTYRVYAYNSAGNSLQYSNEVTITTTTSGGGGNSVTDIDGNIYPTVQICNQVWTAKNLSVSKYKNGDIIPQVTDPTQWINLTTGAWCYYENNSANGVIYGKLYNWYAVNDPRGLAPQGWHVPSDGEWNKLVKCVDVSTDTTCEFCYQSSIAGDAMKSTTGWNPPNSVATNSSGFTGLPGGFRSDGGLYSFIGDFGHWWTSTEYNYTVAWQRWLNSNSAIFRSGYPKSYGFSVRCVRD